MATYSVNVVCSNCDHQGIVNIPKGMVIPDKITCPNCGCETARKDTSPCHPHILPFKPVKPCLPRPWTWDHIPHKEKPNPYTLNFEERKLLSDEDWFNLPENKVFKDTHFIDYHDRH